MSEMLIATSSGFVEDDGELVEIERGKTRIASEVLEREGYAEFFDAAVSVRGTDSTRSERRVLLPDGKMVAVDR